MVSPNYGQESGGIRHARACLTSSRLRGEGAAASAVEKLPQHVVHWLTVLLGGRVVRRRRRDGLRGRSVLGRLGRCLGRRGAARDAALAARPAAALAEAAHPLLQQIAEGLAELAAERTARLGSSLSTGRALFPTGRPLLSSEQVADRSPDARTLLAEQALAHFL